MRQRHAQQFMLRHDRLALEDMGDGMIQSLVFQSKAIRGRRMGWADVREFLQRLQFIGLTIAPTAVRALPRSRCP